MKREKRWIPCVSCGKETQVKYPLGGEAPEIYWELRKRSVCKACSMDFYRDHNMCPETIVRENGAGMCRLEWKHEGRCQPYEISEETLRQLREMSNSDAL